MRITLIIIFTLLILVGVGFLMPAIYQLFNLAINNVSVASGQALASIWLLVIGLVIIVFGTMALSNTLDDY